MEIGKEPKNPDEYESAPAPPEESPKRIWEPDKSPPERLWEPEPAEPVKI